MGNHVGGSGSTTKIDTRNILIFCALVKYTTMPPQVEWTGAVEQLSWKPRIFRYKGFLSDEECDHLIKKGSAGLAPSEVCSVLGYIGSGSRFHGVEGYRVDSDCVSSCNEIY